MLNTCYRCGIYRVDKIIDPDGPFATCPECGYRHRFARLPLLIVSGASGAGMGVPGNLESRVERRYFADIHYLALVCDDDALAERLRRRPAWRGSGEIAYIEEHQRFNRWFKSYGSAQPPIRLLDTTDIDEQTTANRVELWINKKLR